MGATTRSAALALYRRALRVARTWEGGATEQQWIRAEARRAFEEHRAVRSERDVEQLIQKGHDQIEVALHYKIPYPRPHYVDPGTVGGDASFRRLSSRRSTDVDKSARSRLSKRFRPERT
ncbi:hypothetical protein PINS_up012241 [Pythium insidiosum]|nr:hypothetical protein PINS_up012241 [Pythium insidiosum]